MPSAIPKKGESLKEISPKISKEWHPTKNHPFTTKDVKSGSSKSRWWKCKKGHEWQAAPKTRLRGDQCPVCSGRKVLAGFNDLKTTHPIIAEEADGWDPRTVSAGSNKKVGWKCKARHQWTAVVSSRASGRGCPVCANKKVLTGYNDLATTHPDIAKEADGWDPTIVTRGHKSSKAWKCADGHKWKTSVSGRTVRGNGCPTCGNKKVLAGYNDLATTHPDIAKEADGWDPTTVTAGSGKKRKFRCKNGHQYMSTPGVRLRGRGCSVCAGKSIIIGINDLVTTHPDIAKEADGWDPTTLTASSNKKRIWKCEQGHKWKTNPLHRTHGKGQGCPTCGNKVALAGFNDLASTRPDLALQADGWDPATVTPHSGERKSWKCEKGHVWKQTVAARFDGRNCPVCSESGFNPGKPGWLYFIENDEMDMFQIGISNQPEVRLKQHARSDWTTIELRGPMDGFLTRQLETSCLHALEQRGAILGHKAGIVKFDGYSEAWTKASLNVTSIKQILDWVYEDERLPIKGGSEQ